MTDKTEKTEKPEKRVTFVPAVSFTGWPDGYNKTTRHGVEFVAGVESIPVPQSFVETARGNGQVADTSTKADAAEKSTA